MVGMLALLVGIAVAVSPSSPAPAAASARCANAERVAVGESQRRQAVRTVFCLVNIERRTAGKRLLRRSIQLERVAQRQSNDMVRHKYVGHVNHAGQNIRTRVLRSGYPRRYSGEAVLWGTGAQRSPAALVRKLLSTPAHRRIILATRFRDLGVGLALRAPLAGRPNGATLTLTVGRRR